VLLLVGGLLIACSAPNVAEPAGTPITASATPIASATPAASATSIAADAADTPISSAPTPTYELIVLPTEKPLMPLTPLPTLQVVPAFTPVGPPQRATDTPGAEDDASDLVGPEWQIAASGDLNEDGQRDVLAYRPASVTPAAAMQSYLEEYPIVAARIAIVQEGSDGAPQTMLQIDERGVQTDGVYLSTYQADVPELTPAAFLLQVGDSPDEVLAVIPINADGEGFAQGLGVYWEPAQNTYRLLGPGGVRVPDPPALTPPAATP
jgi:hypothetical protein